MLKSIIQDTEKRFAKWAVKCLVDWQNETIPKNLIRFHGTKDKLFPLEKTSSIHWVDGGGHFMIVDKAEELNKRISSEINKIFET